MDESLLSFILNSVSDRIVLVQVESVKEKRYRVQYANDNFLNMVGYQKNEVEGKLIHSVLPKISHNLISKYEEAIHTKKPTRYNPTHITPIGPITVQVTFTPLFDGNNQCTHILHTGVDITTQIQKDKDSDAQLKESEQKFKTFFSSAPDGIAVVDIDTLKFKLVNPSFCKMLGYSEHELIKLKVTDVHPKEIDHRVRAEVKAPIADRLHLIQDIAYQKKNGDIFYGDTSVRKIWLGDKEINLAFIRDVSDQKKSSCRSVDAPKSL